MDERNTILCLAAAMIFPIAIAPVRAQSGASNAAALISGSPSYNFGELDNRKTVEHTFILRNSGDKPIEITKIFSGCKCASATNKESVVAAGKETEIAAKIVLHGREGEQKKSFYVHYRATDSVSGEPTNHSTSLMAGHSTSLSSLVLEIPWDCLLNRARERWGGGESSLCRPILVH